MAIKNVFFLVAVVCIIVVSVNAQQPPFPFPFPFPFQPSPGTPGVPDIAKCWSAVMSIPGCIAEISQAILTGKFNIGPACCKAFLEAEANCLPKLPVNPFFPPMLKEQCSKIAGGPAPATTN